VRCGRKTVRPPRRPWSVNPPSTKHAIPEVSAFVRHESDYCSL